MIVFVLGIAALIIFIAYMMIRLALSNGGRAALEPELLVVDELAPESAVSVAFDPDPVMESRL